MLRWIYQVTIQKIHAYVPLPDFDLRTPFYGASRFTYDPERDEFRYPEGQVLRRKIAKCTEGVVVYQAEATRCNGCPLKAACTESSQGRQVRRSLYAKYLDRVRAYHETAVYEKAIAKRKVWVEPLFGEAKDWHGLERFRFRRLWKVNIEALLIATGQNLKRLPESDAGSAEHGRMGLRKLRSPTTDCLNQADGRPHPPDNHHIAIHHRNNAALSWSGAAFFNRSNHSTTRPGARLP